MPRGFAFLLVLFLTTVVGPTAATETGATTLSACTTTQLNVISYDVSVATGSVGDLFWVADIGARACTLRGYPRASYWGNYGSVQSEARSTPVVGESHGRRRFDFAGVANDRALPTVTLSPDGAIASFWIFGTDMPGRLADGHLSRCIVSYEMWGRCRRDRRRSLSLRKEPGTSTGAGQLRSTRSSRATRARTPHFLSTACSAQLFPDFKGCQILSTNSRQTQTHSKSGFAHRRMCTSVQRCRCNLGSNRQMETIGRPWQLWPQ